MDASIDPARMEAAAAEAETFLRLIASRHRLMILCCLMDGELSVGEINRRIPLSQSNLSRHLALLRADELVATRRDGNVIHYRIASSRVMPIMREVANLFCPPAEAEAATAVCDAAP